MTDYIASCAERAGWKSLTLRSLRGPRPGFDRPIGVVSGPKLKGDPVVDGGRSR